MKKNKLGVIIATTVMLGGITLDLSMTPYKIVTNGERYITAYAADNVQKTVTEPVKISEMLTNIGDSKPLTDPTNDPDAKSEYRLTENLDQQGGAIVYRDPISLEHPFTVKARINTGPKADNQGGGDGIALVFARGPLFSKSESELAASSLSKGEGMGLDKRDGIDNFTGFVGFKVDTYHNSADYNPASKAYGSIIRNNDAGEVRNFDNRTEGTKSGTTFPADVSRPLDMYRDILFSYTVEDQTDADGNVTKLKTLTITYDESNNQGFKTTWSINNKDLPAFFDNTDPVYFMASASTGGNKNPQSIEVDSLTYTQGFDRTKHQPTLNDTLVENTKTLSGTGIPGDDIVIYGSGVDADGKKEVLGRTTVKEDGTYSFGGDGEPELSRPLVKDEKITAVAVSKPDEVTGKITESDPATQTVKAYNPADHAIALTQPKNTDTSVSGTGTPGDTIVLKDANGDTIGTTVVKADGTYTIDNLSRPLIADETLTATPMTGTNAGTPVDTTVAFDKASHVATIGDTKEGATSVTGTGVKGDTITLKDADGNTLGTTVVKDDGTYTIDKLTRPLNVDEKITATPTTEVTQLDGTVVKETGTPGDTTVQYDKAQHEVTIDPLAEGATQLTGTGTAGDVITVTNGSVTKTTTVNPDGTYTIPLDTPVVLDEKWTATPTTNGTHKGDEAGQTVAYDSGQHIVTVNKPVEGTNKVTGTGTPGDTVTVTDAAGNVLGEGKVAEDGTYSVTTNRELTAKDGVIVTPTTQTSEGEKTGIASEKTVGYVESLHNVTIDQPKEKTTVVTGTGKNGDTVEIKDSEGKVLGSAVVVEGTYTVSTNRPLKADEKLTATPVTTVLTPDLKSETTQAGKSEETTVLYDATKHTVQPNTPTDMVQEVTGKGTPGDTITVTDKNGTELGTGFVDDQGNFVVETNRPLDPGETLQVTPSTGENKGTATPTTVEYDEDAHKVKANTPVDTKPEVTGTGVAGDTVTVLDKDGKEIGTGKVDSEGNFAVTTTRPLVPGEDLTLVPSTGSNKGTPTATTVDYDKAGHTVTPNTPVDTKPEVTGTGIVGDTVTVTDKAGKEIGTGTVDTDGNFAITTTRPLVPGENLTVTPSTDGNIGTAAPTTVTYDKDGHKVTADTPNDMTPEVTGKGVPGDTVTVTDKDGKEIGTGTVDTDGNFVVETTRPLVPGEELTVTPSTGDNTGTPTNTTVSYDKDGHKATPNTPVDTKPEVTGKGVAGDTITVTDKDGKEIGTGTVDKDGNFVVETTRPLVPGESLTVTPSTGDNVATPTDTTVDYDKAGHTPTVETPVDTKPEVTGTGVAGDTIIVTDKDGKEIGTGTVDKDGNYAIETTRPLVPGENLTVTPKTGDNTGTPADTTVSYDKDGHKVTPETPKEGDTAVSGTGTPGDTVVVTDKDGNKLGEGVVDKDGNFTVDLDREVKPGEDLTLTPNTGDNKGTPTTVEADYDKAAHKVTPNTPVDTKPEVTGKGVAGDTVTVTDKDGKEIGTGTVDKDGNFVVETTRPLVPGEKLVVTPSTGDNIGTPTDTTVDYDEAGHKPTVNAPTDTKPEVTGTGTPGDAIVVTDKDGKEIGTGTVDKDGNYTVETTRPLVPGEELVVTPNTGDNKGTPTDITVSYDKDAHKPTVETPVDTKPEVTGSGTPGDTIVVTDKDGKEIGTGTVDKDGNYIVETTRPLVPGENLTVTPNTGDNKGTPTDTTVSYDKDGHKVTPEAPKEGDTSVSGTGTPGDKVVVTDKDGNKLGEGIVDKDGNVTVDLDREVKPGEELTLTPNTGTNVGTPTTTTPKYDQDTHKPTVETPVDTKPEVTGTGVPGDTIVVTDKDGKEIGTGTVDKDGNYAITTTRPLVPGEELVVTPNTGDNKGTPTDTTVSYDPDGHKVTPTTPTEGDTSVSGTGTPGDKVVVTDKDGNKLGEGTVDKDGNFTVDLDREVKPGEALTVTPNTGDNKGPAATVVADEKPATYNPNDHKVTPTTPTEGDTSVSGTGTPGDTVVVTDKDGNKLGEGTVDKDGNFTVDLGREVKPGEALTVTPSTGDNKGPAATVVANEKPATYNPAEHVISATKPTEGDTSVSGTGTPGDTVTVTDKAGTVIGSGTVNPDGSFTIPVNRPLVKDEVVTLTPSTGDNKGTPTNEIVNGKSTPVEPAHKATVAKPTEGDTSVSGTGTPGDTVIIKDAAGNQIGKGTVDANGNYTAPVSRPLVADELISVTPMTGEKAGTTTKEIVDKKAAPVEEAHKVAVVKPTEGDTSVGGTGVPGDKVVITDANGNQLGSGVVDANGNYTVPVSRPLVKNEGIIVTPMTGEQAGIATKEIVDEKATTPEAHKVAVVKPIEGDTSVRGTGVPGDKVVITDANGNQLGSGVVDANGNYTVPVSRPLTANEMIVVTPMTGEQAGIATKEIVDEKAKPVEEAHKVVVDKPIENDTEVTGTGTPGDTVVVTDANGKQIGTGTVDANGNYSVSVRPLVKDEIINVTPVTNGQAGITTKEIVEEESAPVDVADQLTIEKPLEGATTVSGTGIPEDTIVITDAKGNQLGTAVVDADGNYTVSVNRPLIANETITATAVTDGKAGESIDEIVQEKTYNTNDHKVTPTTPVAGDKVVTGTGTPGDNVTVTDKDGNKLGEGTVDKDGNFTVELDREVKPGEELTITPSTGDNKGPVANVTVKAAQDDSLTVKKPVTGDTSISGTGTVDTKGQFVINLNRPLTLGEEITISSNDGEQQKVTVGSKLSGTGFGHLTNTGSGTSTNSNPFASGSSTGYKPSTTSYKSLPSTNEKVSIGTTIAGAFAVLSSFALAIFSRNKRKE
ncbi:large repetitive protein [Enterococcus sp. AZ150]|uniref:Ig-like domain-containing protein n=1 Tax=Enterococcus sp. AZ150 TaxID=2774866 RepID=UPI003F1ED52B